MSTQLESIQLQGETTSGHIFDVRRSNSVTELWKRYKVDRIEQDRAGDHSSRKSSVAGSFHDAQQEPSASSDSFLPPIPNEPRPLMEAFEAELAEMLKSTDTSENKPAQPTPPPAAERSTNSTSARTPHPVEVLAAHVMDQLANGAHMVQSEWRARVPELQRQLQNAQRQLEATHIHLPQNVETSLRALLATLEAQLRTAFNNIPDGGRRMAEDVLQTGRPVADNAADGLRMMATELNEVGRTLFSAFDREFGRPAPTAAASNSEPAPAMPTYPQGSTHPSNEKSMPNPGESQSAFINPPNNLHEDPPSHFPPHPSAPHAPLHPNQWVPPPIPPSGPWNMFQNFQTPPPPYPSHPPTQQPLVWPQPRSQPRTTPWPHWRPASIPPTHIGTSNLRQASAAKPRRFRTGGSATKSLFVGNVGFSVTEQTLEDVFAAGGFIVEVDLPTDATSEIHAGFGYIHFPSEEQASAAMGHLQGARIDGLAINLEYMHHPSIEEVHAAQDMSRHETLARAKSDPKKSVKFADKNGINSAQSHSSALLDSPSDDPAFSARFPSLLPEASPQHNIQGVPSSSHSGAEMSRFPPVSQQDAQLLAGNVATGPNQTLYAGSLRRRSTEHQPHHAEHDHSANNMRLNNLFHLVSMDDLGRGVRGVTTTESTAPPQPPAYNAPADEISPDLTSAGGNANVSGIGNSDIEQCITALFDMGYGTELQGGQSRLAVYAAAADGSLLDAIEMIEEERKVYEYRASS